MKPWKFAFLTVLLFPIWCTSIPTTSTLITSTCNTTSQNDPNINYTFCSTSLMQQGSRCANLQCLAKFTVQLLIQNITDTSCYINRMMKTGGWDPYVGRCLSGCFEMFSDAVSSAEEASSCYEEKRFDDANAKISSIMDAAVTCDDGFKERRGVFSPLTKRNSDAFQLSAMALALMHMVQTGSD